GSGLAVPAGVGSSGITTVGDGAGFPSSGNFGVPGATIDGADFAILSSNYDATKSSVNSNKDPYAMAGVQFTLSVNQTTFTLSVIGTISVQFGTAFDDTRVSVPEPSVIACAGTVALFGLGLVWRRRKSRTA